MQPAPKTLEPTPALLAARSPLGRLWIAAFACAALYPGFGYLAPAFAAAIGLASFRPIWRRSVLSLLAILICARDFLPQAATGVSPLMANRLSAGAAALAAIWLAFLIVGQAVSLRRAGSPPASRSLPALLLLHLLTLSLIVALWLIAGRGLITALTVGTLCGLVPELLWRSAYWIKWRARQGPKAPIWRNLFAVLPFLGAGGVPIGKGPAYLAAHEAHDAASLAAAQIEGSRLLALALAWRIADSVLSAVLWARPSDWTPAWAVSPHPVLPSMDLLLRVPGLYPLALRWAALYAELFHAILVLAVFSHTLVGIFCLMGFHIPRNMRSPLLARTILDFWGRYFFYFKELLMDFFFFPVFLRASRLPVLWRTVLATAAAAFAGNLYYHVILYWPTLAAGYAEGFRSLIAARIIYCALLAAGLSLSFARSLSSRAVPPTSGVPRRLWQALVVSAFFALIHVWNFTGVHITVNHRLQLWRSMLPW